MAMQHFNTRDPCVVPELRHYDWCPVQFDWNHSLAFDAPAFSHATVEQLVHTIAEQGVPCAAVGPFHNLMGDRLSAMAAVYHFPLTMPSGLYHVVGFFIPLHDSSLSRRDYHGPRLVASIDAKGTDRFCRLSLSLSPAGVTWREVVSAELDTSDIRNMILGYNGVLTQAANPPFRNDLWKGHLRRSRHWHCRHGQWAPRHLATLGARGAGIGTLEWRILVDLAW